MKKNINELYKIAQNIECPKLSALLTDIIENSDYEKTWADLYHLTMAQTSLLAGDHDKVATFEMFIRQNPFGGGYTVAAGLGPVLEWLSEYGFSDKTVAHLATLTNANGTPMFGAEFLEFLRNQPLQVTIDAVPEGELVFPNQPIVRVTGPEWQVNIIETAFLNGINASSLIATKASRIKRAAGEKPVLEFGLRRAQDMYGMRPTRSAAAGGVFGTSNVDAARRYDITARGTHAHAFVMKYDTEMEAFETMLKHNPDNGSLLVDTYCTVQGVKNAIAAAKKTGVTLNSIRLDSGDMVQLSMDARQLLNTAGMRDTKIVASNDLDEHKITVMRRAGAQIDIWAVGTNLVTAADQPALGGVYKLKQIDGKDRIKISGDLIKTSIPGATETIRLLNNLGHFMGDVITTMNFTTEESGTLTAPIISVDHKTNQFVTYPVGTKFYKPLKRVVTNGAVDMTVARRDVNEIGQATTRNLYKLDDAHQKFEGAREYPVGLEKSLFMKRMEMTFQDRQH